MQRYIILTLSLLLFALPDIFAVSRKKQFSMGERQMYVAPKVGIAIPTHIGRESDEIAFSDVASNGFASGVELLFMQNPMLGVGCELGYITNPYKQQYWDNLAMRGTFDANYKAASAMAVGRIFLSETRLKPMFGVGAGAYLIHNMLNFQSKWQGTTSDETVNYTTNIINLACLAETGLLYKVGRGTFVSISVCFNLVPKLKEEIKTSTDPYTFVERQIVLNPHGNENNFQVKLGLFFGLRERYK